METTGAPDCWSKVCFASTSCSPDTMIRRLGLPAFQRRGLCTVEINSVARIVRMHVAGESQAAKADKAVLAIKRALEEAQAAKEIQGFTKVVRTVCKTEWAYEGAIVFDSLDNFKAYMESDFREKTMKPLLADVTKYSLEPETIYTGNRVYDEP